MRVLKTLKKNYNVWPFDNLKNNKKSVIVEIFPTLYFRKHSIKPKKNTGYTLNQINDALKKYNCYENNFDLDVNLISDFLEIFVRQHN